MSLVNAVMALNLLQVWGGKGQVVADALVDVWECEVASPRSFRLC